VVDSGIGYLYRDALHDLMHVSTINDIKQLGFQFADLKVTKTKTSKCGCAPTRSHESNFGRPFMEVPDA